MRGRLSGRTHACLKQSVSVVGLAGLAILASRAPLGPAR
ncbi:hypothetical protein CSC33_2079 [Pseudomonas aeruginosa]|nr:hypothetical protein CSC33_2079 [Pseudomonas aeruginosa]